MAPTRRDNRATRSSDWQPFDAHDEPEDFNRPFVATDEYLRRWNNDDEPYRDRWGLEPDQ